MYAFIKKRLRFVWSSASQRSFEFLKEALVSSPVLANPSYSLQFDLYCDASAVHVGSMLDQNGRPIEFTSRILNAAELNESITERECLAVIWALNKFHCFFTHIPIKIITDHSELT